MLERGTNAIGDLVPLPASQAPDLACQGGSPPQNFCWVSSRHPCNHRVHAVHSLQQVCRPVQAAYIKERLLMWLLEPASRLRVCGHCFLGLILQDGRLASRLSPRKVGVEDDVCSTNIMSQLYYKFRHRFSASVARVCSLDFISRYVALCFIQNLSLSMAANILSAGQVSFTVHA